MRKSVIGLLRCPLCGQTFSEPESGDSTLNCLAGHSFDKAKQGYVNFLTGAGTKFSQDTPAMVEARELFLVSGHYLPLRKRLSEIVSDTLTQSRKVKNVSNDVESSILDAGTGTGWYLEGILGLEDDVPKNAVALDISKFALRKAGRRNSQVANVVWDIWSPLPLASSSFDCIIVVFAPKNVSEFNRVLSPAGSLVVVTPGPRHLASIRSTTHMLGISEDKLAGLDASVGDLFELSMREEMRFNLTLDRESLLSVALMGPAGHHLDPDALAVSLLQGPETVTTEAHFWISVFDRKGSAAC